MLIVLSFFLACINWPSTTYHTNLALFLKSRLTFYVKTLGEVLTASTQDDTKVFYWVQ